MFHSQLQQSEDAREAEMTDLNQLTEEFTKRISDTEKRLSLAAKVWPLSYNLPKIPIALYGVCYLVI